MLKDEKCTSKACKNIVFHCQICKGFLLPSSSWLLKLPIICSFSRGYHVHQGHTRKFQKRRSQRQRQCHKSTIGKYNRASRAARTLALFVAHYASVMTLNNWETIAETWSYIFKWRFLCRQCCVRLSSLSYNALQICYAQRSTVHTPRMCWKPWLVKQSRNLDKGASQWAISELPLASFSKRVLGPVCSKHG